MSRILKKDKPLNKTRSTKLVVFISILSVIMIAGVTFAWFYFQGGEDVELNVGKVELNTSVSITDNISTVVPGEVVVTESSFSKSSAGEKCYVRANLEYYSDSKNLTREEKNYIVALNAQDYSSYISTGVGTTSWLNANNNYYYLVDGNGDLLVVNDTSLYSFATNLVLEPMLDLMADGFVMDKVISDLHLKVKFQAIQSEYLPSSEFDDVVDIFNICFRTKPQEEFLVRFVDDDSNVIEPQVIKRGEKIIQPTDGDVKFQLYLDEEMTEKFDVDTTIEKSYTLYGKWVKGESTFTEGLVFMDNKVIGYLGDSQKVVIPASYSLSGERTLVSSTSDKLDNFYTDFMMLQMFMNIDYDCYPATIINGGVPTVFNNADEVEAYMNSMDIMSMRYPVTIEYYIDKAVDGEDYTVTTIGANSLANMPMMIYYMMEGMLSPTYKKNISEVVMSEGITTIEEYAFGAQTLNMLTFPSTLETIGECAFMFSTIFSLHIPSTVANIASDAFAQTTIFEVYNETSTDLESQGANIMLSLDSLDNSMFYTFELEEYTLYFAHQEGFNSILVSATTNADTEMILIPFSGENITHLYSGEKVAMTDIDIYDNAFLGDHNLKVVAIGDSVQSVGANVFKDCINVEYLITFNSAVATATRNQVPTYLIQDNGYEGLTFEESEYQGICVTEDGSWIQVDGEMYFRKEITGISFSEGLTIEDGVVTNYAGDDAQVVIPETYSLVEGTVRSRLIYIYLTGDEIVYPFKILSPVGDLLVTSSEDLNLYESILERYEEIEYFFWYVEYQGMIPVDGTDYTVTGIANGAFAYQSNMISITLPSTLTSIESGAFSTNIKLVEIINKSSIDLSGNPGEITTKAKNIVTSEEESKLVVLDDFLFYNGGAGDVHLMTYVGEDTEIVTPVNFNGNTYEIYNAAFATYDFDSVISNITSLTISSGVTSVGSSAISGCYNLNELIFNATSCEDNYMEEEPMIYAGREGAGIHVTIGANVTKIPGYFFCGAKINSVEFQSGSVCREIRECAFASCHRLNRIVLPSGLTTIGDSAFINCNGLAEVVDLCPLDIQKGQATNGYVASYAKIVYTSTGTTKLVTDSNNFVFYVGGANDTYLLKYQGNQSSIVLPSNCNGYSYAINDYAFNEMKNLTSVTIPNGVTSIGLYAFECCVSLTSITIPSTVTSIRHGAFYQCFYVTEINFNATNMADLTSSNWVFGNVGGKTRNLVVVNIGANVTRIPAYLFSPGDYETQIDDLVTYSTLKIGKINFAEGSVCSSIGNYAFCFNCGDGMIGAYSSSIFIKLPSTITSIGTSILPSSFDYFGSYVLCSSTAIAEMVFNSGVSYAYAPDTTTDFSSVSYWYPIDNNGNYHYNDGTNYYVRTGSVGNYTYYKKYVAA